MSCFILFLCQPYHPQRKDYEMISEMTIRMDQPDLKTDCKMDSWSDGRVVMTEIVTRRPCQVLSSKLATPHQS